MGEEKSGSQRRKACVVGAGIVGTCTAFYLNQAGYEVTVIDENENPGDGTSYANAGRMCPTLISNYSLASPKVLFGLVNVPWERVKKFFGADSGHGSSDIPSHVEINKDLVLWGAWFLRNCTASRYEVTNREFRKITLLSVKATGDLLKRIPGGLKSVDFKGDNIWVYGSEKDRKAALGKCQSAARSGFDHWEVLNKDVCASKFPTVAGFIDYLNKEGSDPCCVVSHDDYSVDAKKFTIQVAKLCAENRQNPVKFHFSTRVQGVVNSEGKDKIDGLVIESSSGKREEIACDHVVFCTGPQAVSFAKRHFDVNLLIYGMRGCSIDLFGVKNGPNLAFADYTCGPLNYQVTPFGKDSARLIGFADLVPVNLSDSSTWPTAPLNRVACPSHYEPLLINRTKLAFPSMTWKESRKPWCGIRPVTPDMLPILGNASNYKNVWLNVGHGSIGWSLSTGSALIACRDILRADNLDQSKESSYIVSMTQKYGIESSSPTLTMKRFSLLSFLLPTRLFFPSS